MPTRRTDALFVTGLFTGLLALLLLAGAWLSGTLGTLPRSLVGDPF